MTPRPALLWSGAGALAAAMVLTAIVAEHSAPLPGDIRIARWVQAQGWFGPVADLANPFGTSVQWLVLPLAVVLVVTVATVRGRAPAPPCVTLAAAALLRPLSGPIKELAASPRPGEGFGTPVDLIEGSYGFPSGHVFADVLVYGAVAYALSSVAGRHASRAAWGFAAILGTLAGPARIHVGAHWPSDVVGGYLWGFAALVFAIIAGDLTARRTRQARGTPPAGSARSTPGG